ncbi:DUF2249 domain-containing protein [Paeniglutamicibacter cryotolerans]|uniref:Uncharacterized protein (DUF2249 family) n=1 Tax=Paeniglutamicibacter cryotolerans TaxID=670079 RepID=A0A839QH23_9MICC|nr:DUF2249 domain-containing protein [Paeniglutamicibacter cryotolerans]MBB2994034.1 uncharacterized protein (DUF2249 family) [Paeniglutamicibacter cryotolerans]
MEERTESAAQGEPFISIPHTVTDLDDVVGNPDRIFDKVTYRPIPHNIRHDTIFGALDSLAVGSGPIRVAPHNPLRLFARLEARAQGGFATSCLEEGPEAWRLRLIRET